MAESFYYGIKVYGMKVKKEVFECIHLTWSGENEHWYCGVLRTLGAHN